MSVHMGYRLAAVRAGVEDDTVAVFRKSLGDRDVVSVRDDLIEQPSARRP